jgi:UDP-N-acetylglucosamine--N-acetylmuramyl-(pentapeptide) pyrophosphoryl-undecaprenol N-acetylglucosamine transferase
MESKKMIAITWGWTWWHIFPLLWIYNHLKEKYNFIWVWEQWWIEEEIALNNNIHFLDISAWKLRRYFDIRNFFEPLKNLTWIVEWIYYILKYKIDIVFSKWWYVSIPLCISAKLLWKKIFVHESDTIWWVSNRLIWKLATKIFYTFPNEKIDWIKHILSWQLLNQELLTNINLDDSNKPSDVIDENEKLNVVVIAWSQWSTNIFNNLLNILPEVNDINFNIILWEKNLAFKDNFSNFENVTTYDFIEQKELWNIFKQSDIAITRAWATTLWELFYFWVHSIIIPLSWSAWNHQEKNWAFFKDNFWSDLILESKEKWDDEEKNIWEEILKLLNKYSWLRKHWLNLEGFDQALEIIDNEIEKIFEKKSENI